MLLHKITSFLCIKHANEKLKPENIEYFNLFVPTLVIIISSSLCESQMLPIFLVVVNIQKEMD